MKQTPVLIFHPHYTKVSVRKLGLSAFPPRTQRRNAVCSYVLKSNLQANQIYTIRNAQIYVNIEQTRKSRKSTTTNTEFEILCVVFLTITYTLSTFHDNLLVKRIKFQEMPRKPTQRMSMYFNQYIQHKKNSNDAMISIYQVSSVNFLLQSKHHACVNRPTILQRKTLKHAIFRDLLS